MAAIIFQRGLHVEVLGMRAPMESNGDPLGLLRDKRAQVEQMWADGAGKERLLRAIDSLIDDLGGKQDDATASRQTRREHNQLMFRRANELLFTALTRLASKPERARFLCECAAFDCFETVDVEARQWHAVASQHNHFLMNAGHQRSEGEEVVGHLGEYEIARKPD